MDVQLSLQLVKEEDGQFTLLAATVTPSQAFRPAEPFIGAPAGEIVLAETLPVTLPLVLFGSPPVPSTAVVYHTLSDVQIAEQQSEVTAYVTLGGVALQSQTVKRASATPFLFRVNVAGLAPAGTLAAIQPDQVELTLEQAGIIVQDAVPGPDVPFSTKLENAVGVSPNRLAAFQEAVFQGVRDRQFKITKTDIPKSASTKLSDVRTVVQAKARRQG